MKTFSEFINEKSELEKLIPLVKKANKEINKVKLVKMNNKFGEGEYLEVTFKNSEFRAETVTFLKANLKGDFAYDYDGTALLISQK